MSWELRRRRTIAGFLAASFAVSLATVTPALAAETYDVFVGLPLTGGALRGESTRFFPSTLSIHRGDVLRFRSGGAHSATLLPTSTDPDAWLKQNWRGHTDSWSPVVSDPDSGAGALKLNNQVVFPSIPDCGDPDEVVCSYDGTLPVHSGLPMLYRLDFAVAVHAPVDSTFWVVDLLNPRMRLSVRVVEDGVRASDRSHIDAERTRLRAVDRQEAQALIRKFSRPRKSRTRAGVVWTAYAGLGSRYVTVPGFFPSTLQIEKNQSVRWRFPSDHAAHSVTFSRSFANTLAERFPIVRCDLNGTGSEPDSGPTLLSPPYCDQPDQLELDVPDGFRSRLGDGMKGAGSDTESSGLRGGALGSRPTSFKVRFTSTKRAGYVYGDILHPSMAGKVVVR